MGELLADAGEEEPREAVAVDGGDAGRGDPPDEAEADHAQVFPQPVPGKPVASTHAKGRKKPPDQQREISHIKRDSAPRRSWPKPKATHVMQVILPFLSRFLVISGFLADTRPPRTKPVQRKG